MPSSKLTLLDALLINEIESEVHIKVRSIWPLQWKSPYKSVTNMTIDSDILLLRYNYNLTGEHLKDTHKLIQGIGIVDSMSSVDKKVGGSYDYLND